MLVFLISKLLYRHRIFFWLLSTKSEIEDLFWLLSKKPEIEDVVKVLNIWIQIHAQLV